MTRLRIARTICSLLPPLVAQKARNKIFPLSEGQRLNAGFTRKSVTGSPFTGNTADYHSYRMAVTGYFEWRNIVIANYFFKRKKGDIIEIGANVGTETVSFCDIAKPHNVHAFEPMPKNIADLNVLKKNLPNLRLYHSAISDAESTARFKMPPAESSGTGKIITENTSTDNDTLIVVKTAPLDSFLEKFNSVTFVSIDTEGHEPFVLKGSRAVFEKFSPAVVIEVCPSLLEKYAHAGAKDIFDFFDSAGYCCYQINSLSLKEISPEMLKDRKAHNWLCVPKRDKAMIPKLEKTLRIRALVPWFLLPALG